MPNKYSDHALFAIEQAPIISASMGHTYTGTEHLLLAILIREDCVGARILSSKGLDYQRARLAVASAVGVGVPHGSEYPSFITENFKKILKKASDATPASVGIITTKTIIDQMISSEDCGAFRIISAQNIIVNTSKCDDSREKAAAPRTNTTTRKPLPHDLCGITEDLTESALGGTVEGIIGREKEINTIFLILSRRQKNSPCLIGSAGVGKTAIARAAALRIALGDCPDALRDKRILTLDTAALLAGTKYRGDIEERVKNIVGYCGANPNVILFIDEIHTIVGAGSSEGSLDTANMLKPALSSGAVRIIGATTRDEYEKFIEKDPALERRFSPVFVSEPTKDQTRDILLGIAPRYEKHHGTRISESTVSLCIRLSDKCMKGRHFPDKAIDALDLACAVAKNEGFAEVLTSHVTNAVSCLISSPVNAEGVPTGINSLAIREALRTQIFGQNRAINDICFVFDALSLGIGNCKRPLCSLLLYGPAGVGKSFTATVLANAIYGDSELSEHFIKVDMSRFSDPHSTSELIGAPAGYVGHGKGSELIRFVKRHPYSVVLLDNVHKAHRDALEIIKRSFDGGILQGCGEVADMSGCIVILTADIDTLTPVANIGFSEAKAKDARSLQELEKTLSKDFLSLFDGVIRFDELTRESALTICEKHLGELIKQYGLSSELDVSRLARDIVDNCEDKKYDAAQILAKTRKVFWEKARFILNKSTLL